MKFCLAIVFLIVMGCETFKHGRVSDFNKLAVGMSKAQVIDEIGAPLETSGNADLGEEYMYYKKMKHPSAQSPTRYVVTLRNGKVVKWGEQ
jgi:hypothetical protein